MSFRGVVYSKTEINAYLARIGFPDIEKPSSATVTSAYGLQYLRRLQKYQQSACPFENLNMHYTEEVIKSLKPKDLYEKFVTRRWGGTCTGIFEDRYVYMDFLLTFLLENNTFFGIVLRSLGFKTRPVGGRVNIAMEGGRVSYGGW
jgi:arylamine N-acetyltransferase